MLLHLVTQDRHTHASLSLAYTSLILNSKDMAPSHYSEEALPVNVERNMFLTEGLCVTQLYRTHLLSSPMTEELCAISSIGLIYLVAQCDQSCLLASYMGKPT